MGDVNIEKREKEIEEANRMREQERKTARMMSEVKATRTRAEAQMKKEYERYVAAKEKGDEKMANDALKMWNFLYKMNQLANRFVMTLDRLQSVQDLFNILSGTSQIFSEIMSLDNGKVMRKMRRNLKKFKSQLKKYESQMDELLVYLDGMFEERPSGIKRLFNKMFKKEEKTTAQILQENELMLADTLKEYAESLGQAAPVSDAGTQQFGGASTPVSSQEQGPLTPGDDIPGGL